MLLVVCASAGVFAQSDPDEMPLGDVARNLRKKAPPSKPVIDDDNLSKVMDDADSHHAGPGFAFLMAGNQRGFQVSAPDVTCSLSFSANVKSLLSHQYDQMDLPPTEVAKIEGKAVLEGDALSVPIFNGTQWHLSEVAVAFTVVRKTGTHSTQTDSSAAATSPAPDLDFFQQVRPEKKPDITVIYRMRAAVLPWSNAVFSAPLNLELEPGEEWHWAIVQAKGYPPETYAAPTPHVSASVPEVTSPQSPQPVSLTTPQNDAPPTPVQLH